jgi:hypothetical protein
MPPKGVDQPAREAMTTKIAQRLTTMLSGQNTIDAARQIEAKCYDSAKDAKDYKRKVEKRLGKAATAFFLGLRRQRQEAAPQARDLLREHGATLEWWLSSDVIIGRRLRAIIDSATQAGSVGDEARTWASAALQKVEKLEKAATSLLKQLEARSGNLAKLPGYCLKLKESKAALEAHLEKLAPQWAPSSIGEAATEYERKVEKRLAKAAEAFYAQDYTYGWRDVPAPVRLDKICCYLDAKAMGRLEICGKNCLGEAQRAWQAKAAGLARGTLGDLSAKQFLRAQTRARALLPPSLGGKSPFMFQHFRRPVSYDEFAFTIVVSWIEPYKSDRCFTEFPFMRLRAHHEAQQGELTSGVFTFFPTAGADHEALSACLRRVSQEFAEADDGLFPGDELAQMDPLAYMTCTRRRDGASTRVGLFTHMHSVNTNDVMDDSTQGSLYFGHGKLLLTDVPGEALEITLNIIWDAPSGRVQAFGCHLYVNGEEGFFDFPEESFLTLLRARLDESVRD